MDESAIELIKALIGKVEPKLDKLDALRAARKEAADRDTTQHLVPAHYALCSLVEMKERLDMLRADDLKNVAAAERDLKKARKAYPDGALLLTPLIEDLNKCNKALKSRPLENEDALKAWLGQVVRSLANGERAMETKFASTTDEGTVEPTPFRSLEEFFYSPANRKYVFLVAHPATTATAICEPALAKRLYKELNAALAKLADSTRGKGDSQTHVFGKTELYLTCSSASRREPPIKKSNITIRRSGAKKSAALSSFWA